VRTGRDGGARMQALPFLLKRCNAWDGGAQFFAYLRHTVGVPFGGSAMPLPLLLNLLLRQASCPYAGSRAVRFARGLFDILCCALPAAILDTWTSSPWTVHLDILPLCCHAYCCVVRLLRRLFFLPDAVWRGALPRQRCRSAGRQYR